MPDTAHSALPELPGKTPLWTRNFIHIILINTFLFFGFQCYPAALPPYLKSLGASDAILGWLTALATVPTLLTRPLAGLLLDRLGRRKVFLSGLLMVTSISLAMYFFPVVGIILLLRFMHGLAWGIANTSSNTVATDIVPKSRLGEGMGFFSLSTAMALAISPAVALSLHSDFMFVLATFCMAISTVLACFLRYPHVPLSGKKHHFPFEKTAVCPALVILFSNTSYGAVITFLAVYAAQRGVENIGPYFTVYALVLLLTRPNIGRLVDRKGHKAALLPGLFFLAGALVLLSQSTSLPMFLASAVLFGVGQGSVQTSAQTLSVLYTPKDRIGAANATFLTGFDGGIGFGALLASGLVGPFGYSGMFLCLTVCPLLAALLFVVMSSGRRNSAQQD